MASPMAPSYLRFTSQPNIYHDLRSYQYVQLAPAQLQQMCWEEQLQSKWGIYHINHMNMNIGN